MARAETKPRTGQPAVARRIGGGAAALVLLAGPLGLCGMRSATPAAQTEAESAPEQTAVGDLWSRYTITRKRLEPKPMPNPGRVLWPGGQPGPAPLFRAGPRREEIRGSWTRVQAGDTVELIALRHGVSPVVLGALNGIPPDGSFSAHTVAFTDYSHRLLPGETLQQVADLYQTTLGVVETLNEWADGAPPPWSKVRVPPRVYLQLIESEESPSDPVHSWSVLELRMKGPHRVVVSTPPELHHVPAGRTLGDVERETGVPRGRLVRLNRLAPEAANAEERDAFEVTFEEDRWLVLDHGVRTRRNATTTDLVLYCETILDCPLELLLELNGVRRPEDLPLGPAPAAEVLVRPPLRDLPEDGEVTLQRGGPKNLWIDDS